MNKLFLITIFLSTIINAQNKVEPQIDIPQSKDVPYYQETDADLKIKGYSDTPPTNPNIKSYQVDYSSKKRDEYMKRLQDKYSDKETQVQEKDPVKEIIETQKNKIDVSGGFITQKQIDSTKKAKEHLENEKKINNQEPTENIYPSATENKNSSNSTIVIIILLGLIFFLLLDSYIKKRNKF